MWKAILAAMTALTIAGATLALAQQAPSSGGPRWRLNAEDAAAITDARVAGLKAGLKLTADQDKNWPAVEAAIRDLAKQRADRMAERMSARQEGRRGDDARPRPDAIERLRRGAAAMTARAASLKTLADAAEPLYKSLDDGQKRRFGLLMHMGRRAEMGPDMMGPGMERGRPGPDMERQRPRR